MGPDPGWHDHDPVFRKELDMHRGASTQPPAAVAGGLAGDRRLEARPGADRTRLLEQRAGDTGHMGSA
jgi:hypothetical protein